MQCKEHDSLATVLQRNAQVEIGSTFITNFLPMFTGEDTHHSLTHSSWIQAAFISCQEHPRGNKGNLMLFKHDLDLREDGVKNCFMVMLLITWNFYFISKQLICYIK